MSATQKPSTSASEIIITIKDPDTGSEVEYRVSSEVGYSLSQLLEAIKPGGGGSGPAWDAACRL
jgi:hypothetical protein